MTSIIGFFRTHNSDNYWLSVYLLINNNQYVMHIAYKY